MRQVENGLQSAKQYVSNLANAPDEEMAGWYMPPQLLTSKEFAQAKEAYMSKDGKVVTFDIVFRPIHMKRKRWKNRRSERSDRSGGERYET